MPSVNPDLRSALSMFARFFDLIHQPLAIIDEQGRYVYYNQESAELDGCSAECALGRHILAVYPRMKESQSTMLCSLKSGVEYVGNYQVYYNARGRAVDYQHTTAPLYARDGSMVGAIEIGRDMSGVRRLQEQVVELNQRLYAAPDEDSHAIITQDPATLALIDKGKRLAQSNVPVIIVGETGTGKELFSRLIHRCSPRAERPFIALNCGALPSTLIESTLFGTVKGAFTGAENSKGYLELADGGTLFLDELNAMPLEMQSKLLRFLQDKTYWKLGGSQQKQSDVRIVAAMNEAPAALIEQGRLRADLFYRLSVGMLALPPLSARPSDILLLANHFLTKYRNDVVHRIHGIAKAAQDTLLRRRWPGNVRMLENTIVRSMIMQDHDGPLDCIAYDEEAQSMIPSRGAYPPSPVEPPPGAYPTAQEAGNLAQRIARYERDQIVQALNHSNGCIAQAARSLGLSRTTLQYKVHKYAIHLGVIETLG
ncbi:putative regulatory protein [Edwardsiella piscicida]|uniref:Sigma-54-dependent Fis family transcriptional regulator n=3 Tax=Edwardsiella TaxID=635 RepID=A0AAQ3H4J7_EDWPI|nr:sigma-54-dependent Fis family transcriptional regulator [Edwardsiella piscicida]ACY85940.1 putative regulatory protein [Edwardsiella tarda EIB202]ADM42906.1 Putative regulatory protein [Edwardsiella tarda FL6-60]BAU80607.1 hypothetical protein SAMD00131843_00258 [Edwardsiella tarda]ARD18710.1 sigma-54-dependent Fis family transcriptional regulator [Edwardsiella piscicida]ELM3659677.1 sigma-54-dependent Fis family transcriptional regulator [Edwardsiella piscicida]